MSQKNKVFENSSASETFYQHVQNKVKYRKMHTKSWEKVVGGEVLLYTVAKSSL